MRFTRTSSLLSIAMLAAAGCGSSENSGIPKKVNDITVQDYTPASAVIAASDKRWKDLIDYFEIKYTRTGESTARVAYGDAKDYPDLVAQLSAVPAIATNISSDKYKALDTGIKTEVITKSLTTQCESVVGIKELTTTSMVSSSTGASVALGGKVYVMRYKLRKADGAAESDARTALVTVPAGAASSPLMMYGHGGDSGLSYSEIVALAGGFQANHVVAAPTFPGEPLCNETDSSVRSCKADQTVVAAVGSRSIYDGDVNEFLGLQNCMVKLNATPASLPSLESDYSTVATGTVSNPFMGRLTTHKTAPDTANPTAMLPKTIAMGASRGGLVAQLAVARSGIMLGDLKTPSTSIIAKMSTAAAFQFYPHTFSAAALAFPPASYLVGSSRLALETMVKGTLKNAPFARLPGMLTLDETLKPYRDGTMDVAKAALEIAKRDVMFMGPYLVGGLQNWTSLDSATGKTKKGSIAIFHGTEDKIVPYSQSKIAHTVYTGSNPAVQQLGLPGVRYQVYAFQPKDDYYSTETCSATDKSFGKTKCLKSASDFNHGRDASFATSFLVNDISAASLAYLEIDATGADEAVVVQINGGIFGAGATAATKGLTRAVYFFSKETPAFYSGTYKDPATVKLTSVTPAVAFGIWYGQSVTAGAMTSTPVDSQ